MTWFAFVLIVTSAVLHATWNLLAKKDKFTLPFYACLTSFGVIACGHVLFWTPIQLSALPWTYWGCHVGSWFFDITYCFGVLYAYRKMDMSSAYPVMRSLPIILTAVATLLLGLGKPLTLCSCIGFFIVFIGALLMPLTRFSDFKPSRYWTPSSLFLLIAAIGTTGYTIFDSQAQRILSASSPGVSSFLCSITYYGSRAIGLSSLMWIISLSTPANRAIARSYIQKRDFKPLLAGMCAAMTYILVLCAMNHVTNVSFVQVFRQLGLPLGMAAGIFILKEKSALVRWIGVSLILLGLLISVLKF